MDPITFKGKEYHGVARAFFALLYDVRYGHKASVSCKQLMKSIPQIHFETPEDRKKLEDRGDITRSSDGSALVNKSGMFDTTVGFIQSDFPSTSGPQDQVINVRIPRELRTRCEHAGGVFTMRFGESAQKSPYINFPGHPDDLPGENLAYVSFDDRKCIIQFDKIKIIIDYTQERTLVSPRSTTAETVTLLARSSVESGYYKISKAFHEQDDSSSDNPFGGDEICVIEVEYEEASISIPDGANKDEVIAEACEQKEGEVYASSSPDEVFVQFSNTDRGNYSTVSKREGQCLGYSIRIIDESVGGGGCFVATAVFGNSNHLARFRMFRDEYLRRTQSGQRFVNWYYLRGPTLANLCRKSAVFRWLARILLTPVSWLLGVFLKPEGQRAQG